MKKTVKTALISLGAVAAAIVLILWYRTTLPSYNYQEGRRAMLAGNYDEAIAHMQKVTGARKFSEFEIPAIKALAQCHAAKGDSITAIAYTRAAALTIDRESIRAYDQWLTAHPDSTEQFESFYTKLLSIQSDGTFAAKLALHYIRKADYDKAAETLFPFVSRSGSEQFAANPDAKAVASVLLSRGMGGYVESPEAACTLAQSCRRRLNDTDDIDVLPFTLIQFATLELVAPSFDKSDDPIACTNRARRYMKAAERLCGGNLSDLERTILTWLDDIMLESEKVQHSPLWWNRKPADWTAYDNDSGFRYAGHTNRSGDISWREGYGVNHPVGWGIGTWNNTHQAFIGKWSGGEPLHGILVYPTGTVLVK